MWAPGETFVEDQAQILDLGFNWNFYAPKIKDRWEFFSQGEMNVEGFFSINFDFPI